MVRLHRHPYKLQTFHTCQTSELPNSLHLPHTIHHLELQTCRNMLSLQLRDTLQWGSFDNRTIHPK